MYWYNFIQILIVIQCIDQDDITHEWSPQTKMNNWIYCGMPVKPAIYILICTSMAEQEKE